MSENNEQKVNNVIDMKPIGTYIWIIGWLFTLGIDSTSFLNALKSTDFFGQIFLMLISYVLWPVILGYHFR